MDYSLKDTEENFESNCCEAQVYACRQELKFAAALLKILKR